MKDKLPFAVKQQILWIVRDYERMRHEYKRLRRNIIDAGGEHYTTYKVNGEERRAYTPSQHTASRTTEDRQMQLDALENSALVKNLRAVEHAKAKIGTELPGMLRDMLQEAVMQNCQDGRKYPYERLYIAGISRANFYRYRNDFFLSIAQELGIYSRE